MNSENENEQTEAVPEKKYPIFLHRESTAEEEEKDGSLYKSKIAHSKEEHELLGEGYFEDLKHIKKVADVFHRHEPVEAAMIQQPKAEVMELPESAADMTKEQLIETLVKHGYKASKLSKKSKNQLLEIFSS